MNQAQPDPLSDSVGDLPVLAVVEVLVMLLRLFEAFANFLEELIPLLHLCLYHWNACLAWREGADGQWCPAIDHLER
jgi:hypothetical protein